MALMLGSVWGLTEVALGFGLRACAHTVSGSLMTGVALFFIAASWSATRKLLVPVLVVMTACLFKLLDAVLLSLPVMHGAIGNPMFAFLMEGLAFLVLILGFRSDPMQKWFSRAILGAGSALIAVALFPLVKYATGVPACVYPGTSVPLSMYYSPVAVALSALTVPLGFVLGERLHYRMENPPARRYPLRSMAPVLAFVACLLLITLFRWTVG